MLPADGRQSSVCESGIALALYRRLSNNRGASASGMGIRDSHFPIGMCQNRMDTASFGTEQ